MRAGWPLFNAKMSKLLPTYLCQHLDTAETLLPHQSDHQASKSKSKQSWTRAPMDFSALQLIRVCTHTVKLLESLSMCLTTKWSAVNSDGSGPERLLFERSSNLRSCTKLREAGSVPMSWLLLKSTSCITGMSEWCW